MGNEQLQKALQAGRLARIKLYHSYVKKIADGETLKPTEIKNMRVLEVEFEESLNGESKNPQIFTSMDEAAAYCGVSKRTISYHLKRGNITQNTDGTFEKSILDNYLAKYGRKKTGSVQGEKKQPLTIEEKKAKASLRYWTAKAKREEMLVRELNKRLVSWPEIQKAWCARVAAVTSGLDALIDRLPPLLEGKNATERREIIKEEIIKLRNMYAEHGKYCPTK